MSERGRAQLHVPGRIACIPACIPAKDDDIQETVAHEPVSPVDASHRLPGHIEVGYMRRLAIGANVQAAVLIVERG